MPHAIRGSIDDPDGAIAELGDDLETAVVVYCSSATCTGSALAAGLLEGRGYRNVLRYSAGKQDWIDAGLLIEGSRATQPDASASPISDRR